LGNSRRCSICTFNSKKDFILFGILLIVYLLLLFPSEFKVKSDLEKIKIKK